MMDFDDSCQTLELGYARFDMRNEVERVHVGASVRPTEIYVSLRFVTANGAKQAIESQGSRFFFRDE